MTTDKLLETILEERDETDRDLAKLSEAKPGVDEAIEAMGRETAATSLSD